MENQTDDLEAHLSSGKENKSHTVAGRRPVMAASATAQPAGKGLHAAQRKHGFWNKLETLLEEGNICAEDLLLFEFVETAEDA